MSDSLPDDQLTFEEISGKNGIDKDSAETTEEAENPEEPAQKLDLEGLPEQYKDYLIAKTGSRLSVNTAQNDVSKFRVYCRFLESQDTTITEADESDLDKFVERHAKNDFARETVRNRLSALKQAHNHIQIHGDPDEFVLSAAHFDEKMRSLPSNWDGGFERSSLTRGEVRKLYNAANKRNEMMIRVILETALRNSDVRNIKFEHLQFDDIEDPTIHIPGPKNDDPYDVPVTQRLVLDIEEYRKCYREAPQNSDYLFPSEHGSKIESNEGFNKAVKEAAKEADIQEVIAESRLRDTQKETMNTDKNYRKWYKVTVHALRHTALTLMVDSGVPRETARYIANHDHMSTLENYLDDKILADKDEFRNEYTPP